MPPYDHLFKQRYLENSSSTHRHFITKLILITARSYTITQRLHNSKFTLVDRAVHSTARLLLVSSPDQIFRACPADSSKNRVWTLSLRKLGQVYIWRAVNWVIVGVNYIISDQHSVCFGAKKFASWLFMMTHNAISPEQSDWCDNMTLRLYNYAPVLPVNVSRPYFSTRPHGAREKFGVWGRD